MAMGNLLSVMVVDQHEDVCRPLARSLGRLAGLKVVGHTSNLMLGAELAHQLEPDVIVADFTWGEGTRPEALAWLRRMSPASTIIVYSSYYINGEREAFTAAGADLCMLKGMSASEFGDQIQAFVHKTACCRSGGAPST
jgi:DNA-binding NarL/FixJ family response regulator